MQWVVTTGDTVDEATQRALDVLGIDESDLEVEVLEVESSRLFGLRTRPARVRARVRPTSPRPKVDRRSRRTKNSAPGRRKRSRRSGNGNSQSGQSPADKAPQESTEQGQKNAPKSSKKPGSDKSKETRNPGSADRSESTDSKGQQKPQPQRSRRGGKEGSAKDMSDIPLAEQESTAVAFVTGLVEAFGATASVSAEMVDDEALEIHVEGDDLGLLVGQRGTTLSSIAELTRTSVAQQHSGRLEGRLRVDIAGYRAKRKEALIRFAGQVAEKVLSGGKSVALEPMSPPDRKIVHDAINETEGVHTSSRGEDRNRHVVVHPD